MPLTNAKEYTRGYADGYKAGLVEGLAGRQCIGEPEVCDLPIACMELSVRAQNCLRGCGCATVGAVADLTENTICHMRGLGKTTADEIARALQALDVHYTAWDFFRLD